MSTEELPILPHLAPEFYTWIWFSSETAGGIFSLPDADGIPVDVWVDERLSFRNPEAHKMRATVTGENAPQSPEARAALASGKVINDIQIQLKTDERAYSLSLKGEGMDISGLKLPPHSGDGYQALFYERMYFVQDVYRLLELFYVVFARLRTHTLWEETIVPAMREWLLGNKQSFDMNEQIARL
ncbi:MAG: hypothetical protein ACON4U_11770 [Myxococcota bacterium]